MFYPVSVFTVSHCVFVLDLLTDVEALCETFDIEDNLIAEPLIKHSKPSTNVTTNQLPSVFESDDSELEDMLDDILERGRSLLKKRPNTALIYSGSCAMDSRLELGVEAQAEIALRRLIVMNTQNLSQNICSPVAGDESETELPPWPQHLLTNWQSRPYHQKASIEMLHSTFDRLFEDMANSYTIHLKHLLQLWLTLNCSGSEDKFNPSVVPVVGMSATSIKNLITTIAWSSSLSLRTWCLALQALTLVSNNIQPGDEWVENFSQLTPVAHIIDHPDFVQLMMRLLSGTGVVFLEKGLAGPSLCRALHDFLVRLQMRCDVVSLNSEPGMKLKGLLLKVVYQLVQPTGPLAARLGPLDAQCKLLQTMLYLDYTNADVSMAMSILESTALLAYSYLSHVDRIKCINIGERLSPATHSFGGIFASVLGTDPNKQDRPVSWDMLLVALLKLLGKLVQTPLPSPSIIVSYSYFICSLLNRNIVIRALSKYSLL